MVETINDITIEYKEGENVLIKELDKEVLTKGAWTTILFKYQEWVAKEEAFGPEKFSIRRYQKRNGEYKLKSKFNISHVAQAKQIIDILGKWV